MDLHYSYFDNLNIINREGKLMSFGPDESWFTSTMISFQHHKLYYITKGKCIITIYNEDYIGTPGSFFFIPAYTVHAYHNISGKPFEQYYTHFDLYPTKTQLFDIFNLPYMVDAKDDNKVIELFSSYISALESPNITDKIRIKSLLFDLITEYITLSNVDTINLVSKSDVCMNNLLSYIENNLHKTITNKELATIARMHPNHMIKFFKSRTGITPSKYVMIQKMEHAKMLLDETDLDLSEIMERIGIEYLSYFSKLFKDFYGVSPTHYRKLPPITRPASYSYFDKLK